MPTGYAQELLDKDLDFNGFVLMCARAMGAAIMMRDDPLDKPIPDEFKPSDYHQKAILKSQARLAKLLKVPDRAAWATRDIKKQCKMYSELSEKNDYAKNIAKMQAMLDKVTAWKPPSKDHQSFKDFMIQQLTSSIESEGYGTDYYDKEVANLQAKKPVQHFWEQVKKARKEIAYHKKEWAGEVKRTNERNKWVRLLRNSLK